MRMATTVCERTLVLGDLHLGHVSTRLASAAALAEVVEPAERIVFNGDSIEERHERRRAEAAAHRSALESLARAAGARALFLTGNHDPEISSRHCLRLAGGRVLVMHGDAVFPAISPWGDSAAEVAAAHREALARRERHGPLALDDRLQLARGISLGMPVPEWTALPRRGTLATILRRIAKPRKVHQIIKCWLEAPGRTAGFIARYAPQTRIVIVGHTHRAGIWRRDGLTIVNLGGFLPGGGCRRAEITSEGVRVRALSERAGRFQLAAPLAELPLP